MSQQTDDFVFFVTLVESGSLTNASITLDMSLPTVSRKLHNLESYYNTKLIQRSAKRFRLTESGQLLFMRSQEIISLINNTKQSISNNHKSIDGKIRIGCLSQFGRQYLNEIINDFSNNYPDITFEILLSDSRMDLVEDELDFLFQIEKPISDNLASIKFVSGRRVYCASAEYFQKNGMPNNPDQLKAHDCICLTRNHHLYNEWFFNQSKSRVQVIPKLISNNSELIQQWLLEGKGIASKLSWDVEEALQQGKLVECLNQYSDISLNLYVVFDGTYFLPRHKIFLDFLVGYAAEEKSD